MKFNDILQLNNIKIGKQNKNNIEQPNTLRTNVLLRNIQHQLDFIQARKSQMQTNKVIKQQELLQLQLAPKASQVDSENID